MKVIHKPSGKILPVRANISNARLKSMDCEKMPELMPVKPVVTDVDKAIEYINDPDIKSVEITVSLDNEETEYDRQIFVPETSKDLHWSKAAKILKELPEDQKEAFLEGETRKAVLKHK